MSQSQLTSKKRKGQEKNSRDKEDPYHALDPTPEYEQLKQIQRSRTEIENRQRDKRHEHRNDQRNKETKKSKSKSSLESSTTPSNSTISKPGSSNTSSEKVGESSSGS